jgi:hypothetical protein
MIGRTSYHDPLPIHRLKLTAKLQIADQRGGLFYGVRDERYGVVDLL